jgi:hypothetical protein
MWLKIVRNQETFSRKPAPSVLETVNAQPMIRSEMSSNRFLSAFIGVHRRFNSFVGIGW